MQTREILSIVALAALGLCLLCGLAKMAMKGPKAKQSCDHACSLLVFVAVVLVGVSQLLEEEGYKELDLPYWEPGVGALPWTFSGEGKMKKKKMSMGLGDSGDKCPNKGVCRENGTPCSNDGPDVKHGGGNDACGTNDICVCSGSGGGQCGTSGTCSPCDLESVTLCTPGMGQCPPAMVGGKMQNRYCRP